MKSNIVACVALLAMTSCLCADLPSIPIDNDPPHGRLSHWNIDSLGVQPEKSARTRLSYAQPRIIWWPQPLGSFLPLIVVYDRASTTRRDALDAR